jgi:S-adenosylmethionine/arginine decarboxylase-like enzyme
MIVAHNKDEETFTQLLSKSISQLEKESSARAEYYLNRGGVSVNVSVNESLYCFC